MEKLEEWAIPGEAVLAGLVLLTFGQGIAILRASSTPSLRALFAGGMFPMRCKNLFVKLAHSGLLAIAILMAAQLPAFSKAPGWMTDYAKALEQAKTENKAVLLDFTGSDWCGWCMKMKKETLDTSMFKHYAEQNLVLVEVDFPHNTVQPDKVKAQNQQLSQQFEVKGFPAFVLLSSDGQLLGRQDGYLEGGATAFLAELKKYYKGSPNAGAKPEDDFSAFFKKPAQSPAP